MDGQTTIQELKDLVEQFKQERNWEKHHTPKNLAMSIAIEAAELMEQFQWDEFSRQQNHDEEVAKELADIVIYCLNLAQTVGIDISRAVKSKLVANAIKYPAPEFKANPDDKTSYLKHKKMYRDEDKA